MRRVDHTDAALLRELDIPTNAGENFAALAIVALARQIGELRDRVAALEAAGEQPKRRGFLAALRQGAQ